MNGRPIWPFALLLVVWGNAVALALGPTARLPGGSWAFVVAGVALIVTSLVAARTYGLRPADLGLGPELGRALRGAAIGAVTSAIAILLAVAAIRLAPIALGRSIAYEPVGVVTPEELAWHLAFFLPIGAVLPEEIAFRGTLFGALAARYGGGAAIVGSAVTFALWHVSVIVPTSGSTTIGPPSPWAIPAMLGALAAVFGGGLLLAGLRRWTGTTASTIVAHWGFNALLLLALRGLA